MQNKKHLFLLWNLLLFSVMPAMAIGVKGIIPAYNQVGPSVMPDTIAPVVAPFEMPQPVRPMFKDRRVVLSLDDTEGTLHTSRLQQAIDQMALQGG